METMIEKKPATPSHFLSNCPTCGYSASLRKLYEINGNSSDDIEILFYNGVEECDTEKYIRWMVGCDIPFIIHGLVVSEKTEEAAINVWNAYVKGEHQEKQSEAAKITNAKRWAKKPEEDYNVIEFRKEAK